MLLPNCFGLFTFLTIIGVFLTDSLATPTSADEVEEKPGLVLDGLLKPGLSRRQSQSCGPVTGANVKGVCYNSSTQCCNGFYTRGFCPGPSNIRCCTIFQHCSGGSGYCNDLNHVSCSVPYLSGLCPGPADVRCCRGLNGATFCTPGGP